MYSFISAVLEETSSNQSTTKVYIFLQQKHLICRIVKCFTMLCFFSQMDTNTLRFRYPYQYRYRGSLYPHFKKYDRYWYCGQCNNQNIATVNILAKTSSDQCLKILPTETSLQWYYQTNPDTNPQLTLSVRIVAHLVVVANSGCLEVMAHPCFIA